MGNVDNVMNYFTNNFQDMEKTFAKDTKIAISDYYGKIGHFIYNRGENVFSNHLQFVKKKDKFKYP